MALVLIYNGKAIEPAPLINITKNYVNSGDGKPLSFFYEITLAGTLLPDKGSPDSDGEFATASEPANEIIVGDFDRFNAIRVKQQAIRRLFSTPGQALEWYFTGQVPVKCYPHVESINFTEGVWVQRSDYSIRLTANRLSGPDLSADPDDTYLDYDQYNLRSASENWSVQDPRDGSETFQVTHTVSATAALAFADEVGVAEPYDNEIAWKSAQAFCKAKIGNEASVETALVNSSVITNIIADYAIVNLVRTETFDEFAGSYSITDNWTIAPSGTVNSIHLYTVRHSTSVGQSSTQLGVFNTYSISGTFTGFGATGSIRYANAETDFNNIIRGAGNAKTLIEAALGAPVAFAIHDAPRSSTITRDTKKGTIGYELTFTDANQTITNTNVHSYDIGVSDAGGNVGNTMSGLTLDQLAIIPIPGRAAGPIIQVIGTRPPLTRTISVTLFLNPKEGTSRWGMADITTIRGNLNTILTSEQIKPVTSSWLTDFRDSFNYQQGVYNATLVYTIEGT